MKPKNLKEFKALIKRYESITLEEIKKAGNIHFAPDKLTGFGTSDTCTLCKIECFECVYHVNTENHCNDGINQKTYREIVYADTPTKLLNAFRARAKHMKTLI